MRNWRLSGGARVLARGLGVVAVVSAVALGTAAPSFAGGLSPGGVGGSAAAAGGAGGSGPGGRSAGPAAPSFAGVLSPGGVGGSAAEAGGAGVSGTGASSAEPAVHVRGGDLVDVGSGDQLWAEDADVARPMGSITKVMAALVVLQAGHLNQRITVTKAAVSYAKR